MPTPLEALEAEVLGLPQQDRSRLLDKLIASLEADRDIELAWTQESARRDNEIEAGSVETEDLDAVLARLRAGLQ